MEQNSPAVGAPVEPTVRHHEWDDDGCCVRCGFDGAEWRDWVMRVYGAMGWKEREARMPPCEEHR